MKTTMRYYYKTIRITKIKKKSVYTKCLQRCGTSEILIYYWQE